MMEDICGTLNINFLRKDGMVFHMNKNCLSHPAKCSYFHKFSCVSIQ